MNKYTKHLSFPALVLEIRAQLYSTNSRAIFTSEFQQFSETHRILKNRRPMFIFYTEYNTTHGYFLKPRPSLKSKGQGYKYPILLDLNSVSVKELA